MSSTSTPWRGGQPLPCINVDVCTRFLSKTVKIFNSLISAHMNINFGAIHLLHTDMRKRSVTTPLMTYPHMVESGMYIWRQNLIVFYFSIFKVLGMEEYKSSKRISVYLSMPSEVQTEGILKVSLSDDQRWSQWWRFMISWNKDLYFIDRSVLLENTTLVKFVQKYICRTTEWHIFH